MSEAGLTFLDELWAARGLRPGAPDPLTAAIVVRGAVALEAQALIAYEQLEMARGEDARSKELHALQLREIEEGRVFREQMLASQRAIEESQRAIVAYQQGFAASIAEDAVRDRERTDLMRSNEERDQRRMEFAEAQAERMGLTTPKPAPVVQLHAVSSAGGDDDEEEDAPRLA